MNQKKSRLSANDYYDLGLKYADGEGVSINLPESFKFFKKAADLGHEKAIAKVAMSLESGEGTVVDVEEAMKYWLKKAELNCSIAQSIFAEYNAKLYNTGPPYTEYRDTAIRWWSKSAENLNYFSMYELGHFLIGLYMDDSFNMEYYDYLVLGYAWLLVAKTKIQDDDDLLRDVLHSLDQVKVHIETQMFYQTSLSEKKRNRLRQETLDEADAKAKEILLGLN